MWKILKNIRTNKQVKFSKSTPRPFSEERSVFSTNDGTTG